MKRISAGLLLQPPAAKQARNRLQEPVDACFAVGGVLVISYGDESETARSPPFTIFATRLASLASASPFSVW